MCYISAFLDLATSLLNCAFENAVIEPDSPNVLSSALTSSLAFFSDFVTTNQWFSAELNRRFLFPEARSPHSPLHRVGREEVSRFALLHAQ